MQFLFVDEEKESLVQQANFYISERNRLQQELKWREEQYLYQKVVTEEREAVGSADAEASRIRMDQLETEHEALVTEYTSIKPKADKAEAWLQEQREAPTQEKPKKSTAKKS